MRSIAVINNHEIIYGWQEAIFCLRHSVYGEAFILKAQVCEAFAGRLHFFFIVTDWRSFREQHCHLFLQDRLIYTTSCHWKRQTEKFSSWSPYLWGGGPACCASESAVRSGSSADARTVSNLCLNKAQWNCFCFCNQLSINFNNRCVLTSLTCLTLMRSSEAAGLLWGRGRAHLDRWEVWYTSPE